MVFRDLRFRRCIFFLFLGIVFALCSCKTVPQNSEGLWQPVCAGVDRMDLKGMEKSQKFSVVRLDLRKGNFIPVAYHNSFDDEGRVFPVSVKTAARETSAVVAINATPFSSISKWNVFAKVIPLGLVYSDNVLHSFPLERYCAAVFTKSSDGIRCKILETQREFTKFLANEDECQVLCALGGYWVILNNGKYGDFKKIKDYRCALGTSENGALVYLLFGKNASFVDCAVILEKLGCDDAMQFDGGSSACLFVENEGKVCRKIDRPVATVLCFCSF